jgi:hypothetical protein
MGLEEFLVNVILLSYLYGVNGQIVSGEKEKGDLRGTSVSAVLDRNMSTQDTNRIKTPVSMIL